MNLYTLNNLTKAINKLNNAFDKTSNNPKTILLDKDENCLKWDDMGQMFIPLRKNCFCFLEPLSNEQKTEIWKEKHEVLPFWMYYDIMRKSLLKQIEDETIKLKEIVGA